jgi:hypothetical protein
VAKLDWAVSCWIVGSKRKAAQNICTEGTESKEHTQKREERIGQFGNAPRASRNADQRFLADPE